MANINKEQRLLEAVNDVVNYFHSNNKRVYATAVQNAVGYVRLFESGNYGFKQFRHGINKNLCESLYYMNCDPYCPLNLKRTVRQILENYRKMNGLPTDDFKSDSGEDLMVDVDTSANLIDAVGTDVAEEGIAIYIIDNTEKGEEYYLSDIVDDLVSKYPEKGAYEVRLGFENKVWEKVKELICHGYFEVTERDQVNGAISAVRRVR
jgi:hypothetical protein